MNEGRNNSLLEEGLREVFLNELEKLIVKFFGNYLIMVFF